ncbi:uncharacterized protein LOC119026695 isoform X2 [Acanthopagrus latus]|uniref:uncharacterized protein LOC119026695 isoform X2 n=1 Tax=Acanthopagrus latus TaxID=8177 RepID=UPI00187C6D0E|nr:uncharacterized protein LOC119026695 isoform X2 [Acanthopagrus latus]
MSFLLSVRPVFPYGSPACSALTHSHVFQCLILPHGSTGSSVCSMPSVWVYVRENTACRQCCKMMPLCWSVLLLCLYTNAEDIAVYRWEGESVTLKCSSEGCPRSVEESIGMYLNRQDCKGEEEEEVLYYHRRRISPRQRFSGRVLTTGSLMNHTITISSLTIEDAGLYRCVYVNKNYDRVKCNGYTLVVREDIAVYRWEGESVTLKCSSEGRPSNAEEYNGLYLYRQDCKGEEEEEVLHHHGRNGRISPQQRFSGRVLTTGSLMNHTITISNLTIEDAGLYRCVYVNKNYDRVKCNGYRLVVREDIAVYRWEGESVTIKCSSEGRPSNAEEYNGLYLYRQQFQEDKEVLYYHRQSDKISLQKRFNSRTETTGSLMNLTITISSLTMEDAGFYRCVYVRENDHRDQCKGYILIVRGKPSVPPNQSPSLALVVIATSAISSLLTVIFILLIQRIKQWTWARTITTQRVSNNNVYEVMTRNAPRPPAAPE